VQVAFPETLYARVYIWLNVTVTTTGWGGLSDAFAAATQAAI
jgi:hypothetical protein